MDETANQRDPDVGAVVHGSKAKRRTYPEDACEQRLLVGKEILLEQLLPVIPEAHQLVLEEVGKGSCIADSIGSVR